MLMPGEGEALVNTSNYNVGHPCRAAGLGKTIQLVVFLAGLHASGLFRPTLVVCPATVLRQWLRELRAWYPPFRVVVLHDSARSGSMDGSRRSKACAY